VSTKTIWELWQGRKMSADNAKRQLLESRNMGAVKLITMLDAHALEEQRVCTEQALKRTRSDLESSFCRWRGHPLLDVFMGQFQGENVKPLTRYKSLLLCGVSRCGKTQRALSLFGFEATLPVNCQGCSPALPSIRMFDRSKHAAILWDEIDNQQVLKNKLAFQSPLQQVTLSQSACNAFAYSTFLYAVPMILCSNTFCMTTSEGKPLPEEDCDWLAENVIEVRLAEGLKWFLEEDEED
jgi:hypothetical protein